MFTDEQKAKCAARELALRRAVYRRKVAAGQMSSAEAASEEGMMAEIAADYSRPREVTLLQFHAWALSRHGLDRASVAAVTELIAEYKADHGGPKR